MPQTIEYRSGTKQKETLLAQRLFLFWRNKT
jgi:hypothetical protein